MASGSEVPLGWQHLVFQLSLYSWLFALAAAILLLCCGFIRIRMARFYKDDDLHFRQPSSSPSSFLV